MTVGIVIPFRDRDGHRAAACARVQAHLADVFSTASFVLADDGGEPFSRGASIMRGVEILSTDDIDVFIACDADLLVPHEQLRQAVDIASEHDGLAIAFSRYKYLTQSQSAQLEHEPYEPIPAGPDAEWAMTGSVGGCHALSRRTLELTGGYPNVFRGWGMEDVAFELIADTLAGPTRRASGDAYHLWHPVDETNNVDAPSYRRNLDALNRLIPTRGNPAALHAVLADLATVPA